MVDILASLALGCLTVSFLFWPKSGAFWKWQRGIRSTQRVLIEDALKHLYDHEYKGLTCTLPSISGALSIPGEQAAKLMARLETLGLVKSKSGRFELTDEGRAYALRIIRIHRLCERYLADETGFAATEWHKRAEVLEHNLSESEAEALAASVGHPSYDPHGDPIPTPSGKLPPNKGLALSHLAEGEVARIVHIEDEPDAIYAQLVALGLHPGMQVEVLDKSQSRISFIADGRENVLAPVFAANITVMPLRERRKIEEPHETLAALDVGEKGEVVGISKACRGQQRRRLMDLGIVPGTVITVEMRSAGGDPTAYKIRGATIALRKTQAEMIQIRRLPEAT